MKAVIHHRATKILLMVFAIAVHLILAYFLLQA
jgi:hypothetical protein